MNKPKTDKKPLDPKVVIKKVQTWQAFPYARKLTCRNYGCDGELEAKVKDEKAVLKCKKCDYIQYSIPKNVLHTKIDQPAVLLKNKKTYQRLLNDIEVSEETKEWEKLKL